MNRTTRLRKLLHAPDILVMPGVHDALSARIAERTGHAAITMGGFAATGSLLAEPDTSQLSLTELADHIARVCDATALPLFADADTGFGNVTNVRRTVRLFERAGAAGLFIEDQVFPKRCGHTPEKAVVTAEEMVGKIKAALDARVDGDLVIMARTDALAVEGLPAAIDRAALYRDAGADLLFVEAPATAEEMARIVREVGGLHLANMVDFGMSPDLDAAALQSLGFAAAVWPVASIFAAAHACIGLMETLKRDGTARGFHERMLSFEAFTDLVGLPEMRRREQATLDVAQALASRA